MTPEIFTFQNTEGELLFKKESRWERGERPQFIMVDDCWLFWHLEGTIYRQVNFNHL